MICFRASEDLAERLGGVPGSRSEFVRLAVEDALGALDGPEKRKVVVPRPEVPKRAFGLSPDAAGLMRVLPGIPRKLCDDLGWMPGRLEKAERELLGAGLIEAVGGRLVAT